MLFKSPKPIKVEIDPHAIHSQSPEVASRLERIATNYQLLDEIWARIENQLADSAPVAVDSSEQTGEVQLPAGAGKSPASTAVDKPGVKRAARQSKPKPR